MALSAFDDKTKEPSAADLARTLGRTAALWEEVQARVASRLGALTTSWGFATKSTGWGLRVRRGERAILYLTPCRGHFLVSFALGEKAVVAARTAKLPAKVVAAIDGAKRYAEGRGVFLKIERAADLPAIEKLAVIKSQH